MEINRKMLGFHPETRYLNDGKYVCIFGVAYIDLYKYFQLLPCTHAQPSHAIHLIPPFPTCKFIWEELTDFGLASVRFQACCLMSCETGSPSSALCGCKEKGFEGL